VGTHDTVHILDGDKSFVLRPTCRAHATYFRILRMLLCSAFGLENTATMYALIRERERPRVVPEAVISVCSMHNVLCERAHGFESALTSSYFGHNHVAYPWVGNFPFFVGARAFI
jgi:hypothetical protein